jgi:ribonucleoside-diphosphate reductase beta chain
MEISTKLKKIQGVQEEDVMSNLLFSPEEIDYKNEPLFLGKGRNVARLDLSIEQTIQSKVDRALGLMWFKSDYSYKVDGEDYAKMESDLQDLYLKNLKFQTLADSIAGRSIAEVFAPVTTNPQLETWWAQHSFYETVVHSPTYAEIVKALPVDAQAVFDDIIVNENITRRAREVISAFEETVKWNAMLSIDDDRYDEHEHMKSIAKSLYALHILEGGLFKSSFITSFSYNENGYMESSSKAIEKIQLDEIQHQQMSEYLIKRLSKDAKWSAAFNEIKEDVVELYKSAHEADYLWIDYVFPEGKFINLLGINNAILKKYVDYNMYNITTNVGIEPFIEKTKNPCVWANKYQKLSNTQVAMKETDSSNYLLGSLDTHITHEDYQNFK